MSLKVKSEEVSEYMRAMLQGISDGTTSGYMLTSGVKFHIGITNEVTVEGGARIVVAHIGGDKTKATDSFVEFEITPNWLSEKDAKILAKLADDFLHPSREKSSPDS